MVCAYEFSLVEHTMRKPVSRALEWCAPRAKTRKRHSATGAVVPVPYKSVTFPIIFPGRSGFPRSLFRGRENCDKQARFVGRLMLTTFTTRTHFYTDG